jgi:hypothetical protein
MEKSGSGISDKHPGSATLLFSYSCFSFSIFRQEFGEPCGYQYERHTQTVPFQITNYEARTPVATFLSFLRGKRHPIVKKLGLQRNALYRY